MNIVFFQLPNITKIKGFHIDFTVQKFEVSIPFISIKVNHLLEVFLFYHIAIADFNKSSKPLKAVHYSDFTMFGVFRGLRHDERHIKLNCNDNLISLWGLIKFIQFNLI